MNYYVNKTASGGGWLKSTVYGALLAGILLALLATAAGGIIYFSNAGEDLLKPVGAVISLAALFAGGFLAAKRGGERGLFRGGAVGVVFCLVLIIIALFDRTFTAAGLVKCIYYLLASSIGGVCGIR